MLRFVSALSAALLLTCSLVSVAGDCNKTVMGGGCTAEVNAGVAAHMRSQPQVKPAVAKAKLPVADVKQVSAPANVKMSKTVNQKPQI